MRNKYLTSTKKQVFAHLSKAILSKTCWNSAVEGIAITPITQFVLTEY